MCAFLLFRGPNRGLRFLYGLLRPIAKRYGRGPVYAIVFVVLAVPIGVAVTDEFGDMDLDELRYAIALSSGDSPHEAAAGDGEDEDDGKSGRAVEEDDENEGESDRDDREDDGSD